MAGRAHDLTEQIEELASAVVLAQANEDDTAQVRALFDALADAAATSELAEELERARGAMKATSSEETLQIIADCVENLQQLMVGDSPAAAKVVRDADTLELMADFLEESESGVANADEVLLAVEASGANPDHVNALFRVFHTIKGVAGFLELKDVPALAHATENVLAQIRDGALKLEGDALETVFDANALMRELIERVRRAVESSSEISDHVGVTTLTRRLDELLHPEVTEVTQAPHAPHAPEAAADPAAIVPVQRLKETVKVDLERVDHMMELIGELLIAESMVAHAPEASSAGSLTFRKQLGQLRKISRDLQDVAMRMRMVPVRGLFQKMARLTRELSRKTGKSVVLETSGEATEMDRSLVERIEDPLVHMLRNAVDHGVESPDERVQTDKPLQAVIKLSAFYEGGSVVIELRDDGRGLRRQKLFESAVRKGLVDANAALTEAETFQLIFAPGFSTASVVTDLSGRGVGMDVVKKNVESLRGRINVSSVEGQGTTFRLTLPLTLAVIDGMLVSCGRERYLIPSLSIVESMKPAPDAVVRHAERREFFKLRGRLIPLVRMAQVLHVEDAKADPSDALVVVVESLGTRLALLVDDVLSQQQVVIKPLANGLEHAEQYAGAAILSDGRVGLILNVDRLSANANVHLPPETAA